MLTRAATRQRITAYARSIAVQRAAEAQPFTEADAVDAAMCALQELRAFEEEDRGQLGPRVLSFRAPRPALARAS